jgi:PhnB protein
MQVEIYLSFAGNCEEALKFYESCLGGKIADIHRYEGSPMDNAQLPPGWKNKVMHATFDAKGTRFMASDGMPGAPAPSYSGFSMSLNIPKDAALARQAFDALAAGGKVTMPFDKAFWGAHFGMLTDKFGVPWMVNSED